MKKIIILVFAMVMIIPLEAKALTGNLKMNCTKSNGQASCKLQGVATDGKVGGVDATVTVSDELELISVTTDSSWQGDGKDGKIVVYDTTGRSNTFDIATIIVKPKNGSNADGKITVDNVTFADENDQDVSIVKLEQGVSIQQNNTVTNKDNTHTLDGKEVVKKTTSQIENPKTADKNILVSILLIIGVVSVGIFSYQKYKAVK